MKLPSFIDGRKTVGDDSAPPKIVLWIPPGGKVVECFDLETASRAASAMAGERPGTKVCVYELIGVAYVPISYPEVAPQARESEALLRAAAAAARA
jgi:hypothetical protein